MVAMSIVLLMSTMHLELLCVRFWMQRIQVQTYISAKVTVLGVKISVQVCHADERPWKTELL